MPVFFLVKHCHRLNLNSESEILAYQFIFFDFSIDYHLSPHLTHYSSWW